LRAQQRKATMGRRSFQTQQRSGGRAAPARRRAAFWLVWQQRGRSQRQQHGGSRRSAQNKEEQDGAEKMNDLVQRCCWCWVLVRVLQLSCHCCHRGHRCHHPTTAGCCCASSNGRASARTTRQRRYWLGQLRLAAVQKGPVGAGPLGRVRLHETAGAKLISLRLARWRVWHAGHRPLVCALGADDEPIDEHGCERAAAAAAAAGTQGRRLAMARGQPGHGRGHGHGRWATAAVMELMAHGGI